MSKIYAIGEIVYDIIFRNAQPQQANAGGSMLNSAVSLSRTGLPVFFIGETGNDEVGKIINLFLLHNKINTDYIQSYTDYKTSIALAFLNEQNDASYVFHKDYPSQRLTLELPEPIAGDIILFGSSFALNTTVRPTLLKLLHTAKANGAMIIYDPNIRKQTNDKNELVSMILENISLATIVRGSDEDFKNIFDCNTDFDLYELVKDNGCNNLIITKNSKAVSLFTLSYIQNYTVKSIITQSTVGAGDNFNAGLIYGLFKEGLLSTQVHECTKEQWNLIINTGIAFASHVCQSFDNYISEAFAKDYIIEKY
jgi:fructokinase